MIADCGSLALRGIPRKPQPPAHFPGLNMLERTYTPAPKPSEPR